MRRAGVRPETRGGWSGRSGWGSGPSSLALPGPRARGGGPEEAWFPLCFCLFGAFRHRWPIGRHGDPAPRE
ncbi:hypothetical protein NDU88_002469 [Pleurodeles waltl]|uniref:Uncharacterized protein n=1 Tax=Pleurodeles waltl TaxID=8319 RepID=A0AAV7UYZ2_PLEWA|nr:hypothetical protein NDU88_002469 [Pleurodeles waltl]